MPPHVKCTPVCFMWWMPRKLTWCCSRRPSRRTPVPKARSMERRKGRRRRSRGAIVSSVVRVSVHYIRTETYAGSRKSFARELRVGTTLPTYSAVLCRVHIHNLPMRISMHYSSAGQLVVALLRKAKKGVFSMIRSQASRPCSTTRFVYMHRHLITASIHHVSVGVFYQTLFRVQDTLAEYRRVTRLRGSKMSPMALAIQDCLAVMCCSPTVYANSHLYRPPSV